VKRVVLDSSALLTLFHNRQGADKVEEVTQLAIGQKRELLLCVVNWGEIFYAVWRDKGPGYAHHVLAKIAQLPIAIIPADVELTRHAAEIKAAHKLPYVDCFAAALAAMRKASLVTSDADFASVSKQVQIIWAT
jgi:predicted nucleic acid-binding protein